MNTNELAKIMLEWDEVQSRADVLKLAIRDAVLSLGETQQAGNVRATYNSGRKSYNYEDVGSDAPQEVVDKHTKTTTRIDWRKVVEEMKVPKDIIPFTQASPSVTLKVK